MATSGRPDFSESEGLQAVGNNNYPEVVPLSHWTSNVLPDRRSIQSSKDAQTLCYDPPQNETPLYQYGGVPLNAEVVSPSLYSKGADATAGEGKLRRRDGSRIIGIRRKTFFILVTVLGLLIVAGAVLGGVLGSVLPKKHSNNTDGNSSSDSSNSPSDVPTSNYSGMQAQDKTSLALLCPPGSTNTYTYYVDANGELVEDFNENGAWGSTGNNTGNITTVATDADAGSPIAVVSFVLANIGYRQIFYVKNGRISTAKTTGSGTWPASYQILPQFVSASQFPLATPKSNALAAVADTQTNALNGIRVYFGSTSGAILEVGMDFIASNMAQPTWHWYQTFNGSDAQSGVASVVVQNRNHLYLRNSTTGALQQLTWNYPSGPKWLLANSTTAAANGVATGGAIAVTSDGQSTNYVFYQNTAGQSVRALSLSNGISDFDTGDFIHTPIGYSIAATWWAGSRADALVVTQNSSAPVTLVYTTLGRNGQLSNSSIFTNN